MISSKPLLFFLEVNLHFVHSVFDVDLSSIFHVLSFDFMHTLNYGVQAVTAEAVSKHVLLLRMLILQYLLINSFN